MSLFAGERHSKVQKSSLEKDEQGKSLHKQAQYTKQQLAGDAPMPILPSLAQMSTVAPEKRRDDASTLRPLDMKTSRGFEIPGAHDMGYSLDVALDYTALRQCIQDLQIAIMSVHEGVSTALYANGKAPYSSHSRYPPQLREIIESVREAVSSSNQVSMILEFQDHTRPYLSGKFPSPIRIRD